MDIDIEEMTGEATVLDLGALRRQIVAEVLQRIEDDRRLRDRLEEARAPRASALRRPQDLV